MPATGPASSVDQPSGACFSQASASWENPGMPRAAIVPSGPALTRFTRTPRGPRSRARYREVASSAALATPIQS